MTRSQFFASQFFFELSKTSSESANQASNYCMEQKILLGFNFFPRVVTESGRMVPWSIIILCFLQSTVWSSGKKTSNSFFNHLIFLSKKTLLTKTLSFGYSSGLINLVSTNIMPQQWQYILNPNTVDIDKANKSISIIYSE